MKSLVVEFDFFIFAVTKFLKISSIRSKTLGLGFSEKQNG